ncbi:unnamed protein product [Caenorhabditis auriculariae]|uniref:Uncharacterized protein n=1 Tax=Caenorhabditis auriculariae TaxID=2777116 RepID=A0A8S1GTH3_9PELO|nr:unnamed protein product [Caenorhabditis auriculariae]
MAKVCTRPPRKVLGGGPAYAAICSDVIRLPPAPISPCLSAAHIFAPRATMNPSLNCYVGEPTSSIRRILPVENELLVPPLVPPRTHPVHLRNRAARECPEWLPPDEPMTCRSRQCSSVGFVDIDDLKKFQELEDEKKGPLVVLRSWFKTSPSRELESHINPGFRHSSTSYGSFRSLPPQLPLRRKKRTIFRRLLSCFNLFHE